MTLKQHQHNTDRDPDAIVYLRADCADDDEAKQAPPRLRGGNTTHHHSRSVAVCRDPVPVRESFGVTVPETCSCGASVTSDCRTFEWPPLPLTTTAALGLLRRTDGHVALEVKPLNYPEESLDWQGLLGLEDPIRREEWVIGLVGDNLVSRTEGTNQPVWSGTEFTPDSLGVLLRQLPSEPAPVWGTPLEGLIEDYHRGREIATGVTPP